MKLTILSMLFTIVVIVTLGALFTNNYTVWTTEALRRQGIETSPVAISDFSFSDSNAKKNGFHEYVSYDGRYILVDFIYTRCNTVCSTLGSNFQKLQQQIKQYGLQNKVKVISISFDPIYDTPSILNKYADRLHADPSIWTFVSINNKEELLSVLNEFGITIIPDGFGGYIHNAAIHVVDPAGDLIYITNVDDYNKILNKIGTFKE